MLDCANVPAIEVAGTEEAADGKAAETKDDVAAGRYVRYQFTPEFLKLRRVGAT